MTPTGYRLQTRKTQNLGSRQQTQDPYVSSKSHYLFRYSVSVADPFILVVLVDVEMSNQICIKGDSHTDPATATATAMPMWIRPHPQLQPCSCGSGLTHSYSHAHADLASPTATAMPMWIRPHPQRTATVMPMQCGYCLSHSYNLAWYT